MSPMMYPESFHPIKINRSTKDFHGKGTVNGIRERDVQRSTSLSTLDYLVGMILPMGHHLTNRTVGVTIQRVSLRAPG
jgi:hypothetical protein